MRILISDIIIKCQMTELTFADERIIEGKGELKQRGELRGSSVPTEKAK